MHSSPDSPDLTILLFLSTIFMIMFFNGSPIELILTALIGLQHTTGEASVKPYPSTIFFLRD